MMLKTLHMADDNFDGDIFLCDTIAKITGTPLQLQVQMEVLIIDRQLEELR